MTVGIIKRAIEEAELSVHRYKMGCVIFKGSRIFASGHNEIRSVAKLDNRHKIFKNALHAEQSAVLKVSDWSKLKGCSILVVKISQSIGSLSLARPCSMCQTLLSYVGIRNIYYSNEYGEIVKEKGQ